MPSSDESWYRRPLGRKHAWTSSSRWKTSTRLVWARSTPPLGIRQRGFFASAEAVRRSRGTTVRARAVILRMLVKALGEAQSYALCVTDFRTCPLCEATCGLAMEVTNGTVERIRGDD